jgi:hypothetical protein
VATAAPARALTNLTDPAAAYHEPGVGYGASRIEKGRKTGLIRQLRALGYEVTLAPAV